MAAATPDSKKGGAARLPILHLLCNLGWNFLPTAQVLAMRGDTREVLLKARLVEVLQTRRYEYKGQWYPLSSSGIEQIVRELSAGLLPEGLLHANERLYGKMAWGITVAEFMPDGKKHQPTIPVIDWFDPAANRWDVTDALEVQSAQGTHSRTPDVVCYVNGLPLVVIEAKPPESADAGKAMVAEGIRQHLRNQRPDEIPQLFAYAQLLLATGQTEARYGTTGTAVKSWARWREEQFDELHQAKVKNAPLSAEVHARLVEDRPAALAAYFHSLGAESTAPTDQDRLLVGLLTPTRLLEFLRGFVLFDRKVGKIVARCAQFFATRAVLSRVNEIRLDGGREGGVIWHTSGSGKHFTMAFVTKTLLFADALAECRVLVVTDRVELEAQLSRNLIPDGAIALATAPQKEGGKSRVLTGRELARRIGSGTERITFTSMHKLNTASRLAECRNGSPDLIVMVDEGLLSHGGGAHERMKKVLPRAACIVFAGTPLLQGDKTSNRFGPVLHAHTPQRAVEDTTVAPLLYDERVLEPVLNEVAVHRWLGRIAAGLGDARRNNLKKGLARKGGASCRIELIAWDIATHFSEHIKTLARGLKGQVVTDSKLDAIRCKKVLDETGLVTSAVVISPPDVREGGTEADEQPLAEVQEWWTQTVVASGMDAQTYEKQVVADFGTDEGPDLLIAVDELLTGLDEPRNAVLYIDKPLRGHSLIQAVARVNRLHDDKHFGLLIDYRGVLRELDAAIDAYQDPQTRTQGGFDIADIEGLYRAFDTQCKRQPALVSGAGDPDVKTTSRQVREPEGVYRVHGRAPDTKSRTEEKTRNETDVLRARLRETIEHDLADDPYAQQVFTELLRHATAEAAAMFNQPLQQYALFKELEQKMGVRCTPGIPKALDDHVCAKAYFGAIKLGLGDASDSACERAYVDEAKAIDACVTKAVAENFLNPHSVEATIRRTLLPRLFGLAGLESAKRILDHVVHIARVRLERGA